MGKTRLGLECLAMAASHGFVPMRVAGTQGAAGLIHFRIGGRNPVAGDYHGKNEVLGFFGSLMERSGGTFRPEVLDILANDDRATVLTRETGHVDDRVLDKRAVHVWSMPGGVCQRFQGYNEETWDDFWV